ncbi:MAG: hypothetical protein B7Z80_22870 [Rhodospirillales bacterium 20-64-7]|nr:MAG: hypothetical protein B7Z80_22870 [Rhodospirillales bacterium 20-64-7]HQT79137.1 rhodanese-like domain-containing protein [Rhodopila sp.]
MSILKRIFGGAGAARPSLIEADALHEQLTKGTAPILVDVRGPAEYSGPLGHISGSRNIPLEQIPAQAPKLIHEKRPIVLVCHSDRRSSMAAKMLRDAGAPAISVLRGGMVAWRAAGR